MRDVVVTLTDISLQKRLEERLRESESRYRQLVERAQDIIYRTDTNGFFTYVNPMGARVMNYPPEELVGKHFLELDPRGPPHARGVAPDRAVPQPDGLQRTTSSRPSPRTAARSGSSRTSSC